MEFIVRARPNPPDLSQFLPLLTGTRGTGYNAAGKMAEDKYIAAYHMGYTSGYGTATTCGEFCVLETPVPLLSLRSKIRCPSCKFLRLSLRKSVHSYTFAFEAALRENKFTFDDPYREGY